MGDLDATVALVGALGRQQRAADEPRVGGTVLAYDAVGKRAQVRIDTDTEPTWMSVYGNVTPAAGDRCWVTFPRPRGVFLSALQ